MDALTYWGGGVVYRHLYSSTSACRVKDKTRLKLLCFEFAGGGDVGVRGGGIWVTLPGIRLEMPPVIIAI